VKKSNNLFLSLLIDILPVVIAFLFAAKVKDGRGGYWQIFSGGVLCLPLRGYGLEWVY
jgi:hypothetical protein